MDTLTHDLSPQVRRRLRAELLRLARLEEDTAATVAAGARYWEPCPPTVSGHRECAVVLRSAADALDAGRACSDRPGARRG